MTEAGVGVRRYKRIEGINSVWGVGRIGLISRIGRICEGQRLKQDAQARIVDRVDKTNLAPVLGR